MATEIERKYLVKGEPWRGAAAKGFEVRQGYLCMDREKVVRVRTTGGRGFLCVKGEGKGITRPEYEYEIPLSDAEEILETLCIGNVIEKTRYLVKYEGLTWEVDEFLGENQGLVVAEVELESEDQVFSKPEWLGEEVSRDPRYLNANLARHPYREWGKKERGSRTEERGVKKIGN